MKEGGREEDEEEGGRKKESRERKKDVSVLRVQYRSRKIETFTNCSDLFLSGQSSRSPVLRDRSSPARRSTRN